MKKKRGIFKKKYILGILCIVVFLVTFVSAGVNLFAANSDRGIYYRNDLSGTYISVAEAYSYYEEQYGSGEAEANRLQYEMLFWNDHGKGQMESAELRRVSNGDIVYTCGRTDLLIPDALRLDYDDFGLCILGKQTAWELFGTVQAEGLKVICEGREYTVAGVSNQIDRIFVAPSSRNGEVGYNRINVIPKDPKQRILIRQEMENRFETGVYQENEFVCWILKLLFLASPVLLGCIGIHFFIPSKWVKKWYVKLGVIVVILVVIGVFAGYPADMIPGAWSDFSFWPDRMGEKMESIHAFLKGSKIEVEMNCFYRIVRCLIWCSLSIFVTIIMGLGMKNYVRNCTEKGKRGGEL